MTELQKKFGPGLAKAIKRNGHNITVDEIFQAIESKKLVLYNSPNSCLVAAYEDGPDGLEGYGLYVTGTLRELVAEVIPQAERDARQRGACRIYQYGFKGYQRVLNKLGFRCKSVLMQKELVDV